MTGIAVAHRAMPGEVIRKMPLFRDWYEMSFIRKESLEDNFLFCCLPFSTF